MTSPAARPASDGALSVTVIVPVRRINDYVRESLTHLAPLTASGVEVLILPDERHPSDGVDESDVVRVIPTGPIGPAEKRDIGASHARGEILAFLDDDAYPRPDWLTYALPHFADHTVAAVGGPAVTPASDGFWQQVSGWALSTRLGSGGALMRYLPDGGVRDVDDWPSVNLLVRKADFRAVGGFDCAYYPGEDTKLCLELTHRLGKRIVYEPAAVVEHHRRDLFFGHFRQVGRYAVHRGHFVRRFPETSRRPLYFLPTLLATGLLLGPLAAARSRLLAVVYAGVTAVYAAALALTGASVARRTGHATLGAAAALGVALTHLWYGVLFVKGLLTPKLSR